MDGGANICLTGNLNSLINVTPIVPFPISVATKGGTLALDDFWTMQGLHPLPLVNGTYYNQLCYFCKNAIETIISPEAILASSKTLCPWMQMGHKGDKLGLITFKSNNVSTTITLALVKQDGLYYLPLAKQDHNWCTTATVLCVAAPTPPTHLHCSRQYVPVTRAHVTESEILMLGLGNPCKDQFDLLPNSVHGIPPTFQYHPFCFIDWKEEARIQKQTSLKAAEQTIDARQHYYMDYGFMRASALQFGPPNKAHNRVLLSHKGFTFYFFIIDKASRYAWVFLTKLKHPLDIADAFLAHFGHDKGGSIWTDQGIELARSLALLNLVLWKHNYTIEMTGSNSPLQNGAVEVYKDKLAIRLHTLLYGSGLPAKYWSLALQHAVYLHNCLFHTVMRKTPIEGYFGFKPDIGHLKLFGSCVCVKRSGNRRAKLDWNNFTGIFLGYTAMDQNICYLDLNTGIVKRSHHAQFDEAWYLQPNRPPVAQLLYDLGLGCIFLFWNNYSFFFRKIR
jgi:hypothetical protein